MSWIWYADVGNCTVHAAAWAGGEWQAPVRLPVDLVGCAEDDEALLTALHEAKLKIVNCEKAVLCISSPPRRSQAEQFVVNQLATDGAVAGNDFPVEVETDYHDPTQIGTDRLLNALAATQKFGKPCVVVDFGSCLTCDAITRQGVLTAGAIAAGLPAMLSGLRALVPHLHTEIEEAMKMCGVNALPPGHNTAQGLALGIVGGLAGTADRLIAIMQDRLGGAAPVIATGGDAATIVPHCQTEMATDEMLTLNGLRLAYEAFADRANGPGN